VVFVVRTSGVEDSFRCVTAPAAQRQQGARRRPVTGNFPGFPPSNTTLITGNKLEDQYYSNYAEIHQDVESKIQI
jgi:hypothetical protein